VALAAPGRVRRVRCPHRHGPVMASGVRRALDAAVDRASESRPLYLFGYLVGDALVSVALFVLGRRLTR
jgi:hypothetical protein